MSSLHAATMAIIDAALPHHGPALWSATRRLATWWQRHPCPAACLAPPDIAGHLVASRGTDARVTTSGGALRRATLTDRPWLLAWSPRPPARHRRRSDRRRGSVPALGDRR